MIFIPALHNNTCIDSTCTSTMVECSFSLKGSFERLVSFVLMLSLIPALSRYRPLFAWTIYALTNVCTSTMVWYSSFHWMVSACLTIEPQLQGRTRLLKYAQTHRKIWVFHYIMQPKWTTILKILQIFKIQTCRYCKHARSDHVCMHTYIHTYILKTIILKTNIANIPKKKLRIVDIQP